MVTGLRALAGAAPIGECELDRTWAAGTVLRGCSCSCSDEARWWATRPAREGAQSVFRRARDMMAGLGALLRRRG
jgi:hypothetical protein